MYWAEKHALYEHSQRPVPGTEVIGTTMAQIIYFGPAAYSFGTLVWSSFLSSEIFVQTLIPHLVTMGLSVIIFVMPYEMIFEMVFKEEYLKTNPLHNYWDNRMYFTAEYDRLNPSTSE